MAVSPGVRQTPPGSFPALTTSRPHRFYAGSITTDSAGNVYLAAYANDTGNEAGVGGGFINGSQGIYQYNDPNFNSIKFKANYRITNNPKIILIVLITFLRPNLIPMEPTIGPW